MLWHPLRELCLSPHTAELTAAGPVSGLSAPSSSPPLPLQLPSRVAHNWASMLLSSLMSVLTAWYFPNQQWASSGGLALPNGLLLFIDRKGVGWTPPQ